jgi:DNA-binding transcriptional MerR regulator
MTVAERPYLSIGEVLALLLEEFPDVTISKIRFLESQGLIEPERTPSGYRKFYDLDVERLRVILREQRENFLPLRVIRDRLETGEIDETAPGGVPRSEETGADRHPSARVRMPEAPAPVSAAVSPVAVAAEPTTLDAATLCVRAGITAKQLAELEAFGLISHQGVGSTVTYSSGDVPIARAAGAFLERGVEGRHLRGWKQAVDREVALFEQLCLPLLRQRNPEARQQVHEMVDELAAAGGELRAALLGAALVPLLDR